MPTKLTALTQATILGAADLLYAVVGGNSRAIPALPLAGRNRIINGTGRINQRGYVSGTATTGANQYTLDRWRVVTSGQSLTFTGTDAGRTMTAPAGGVEQVIEAANIEGGSFVINWTGTATCTVGGVAMSKGSTFTLSANVDCPVRFFNGTFTDVQLEAGTVATPFERVLFGDVLRQCQRYYWTKAAVQYITYQAGGNGFMMHIPCPVTMRIAPSVSFSSVSYLNASAVVAVNISTEGFNFGAAATSLGSCFVLATITADAEL